MPAGGSDGAGSVKNMQGQEGATAPRTAGEETREAGPGGAGRGRPGAGRGQEALAGKGRSKQHGRGHRRREGKARQQLAGSQEGDARMD